jgi:hypothetical protein
MIIQMKIASSPLIKFILHGIGVGIIASFFGSIVFVLAILTSNLIAYPNLISSDSESLSSIAYGISIIILLVFFGTSIPAVIAALTLSAWTEVDLKHRKHSKKNAIRRGGMLGFVFGLALTGFLFWFSISYPAHGVLPLEGSLGIAKNLVIPGLTGIIVAMLAGIWAGVRTANFVQSYKDSH